MIVINGVKKEIGEIIPVYERDYNKLMSMYAQRIAHISATYEIFAELTTIPTGSMYVLTGSGVTDSGRVPPT